MKTCGTAGFIRLVQQNADVHAALGVSEDELMRRWFDWAEDRYLIINPRWFSTRKCR